MADVFCYLLPIIIFIAWMIYHCAARIRWTKTVDDQLFTIMQLHAKLDKLNVQPVKGSDDGN